MKHKKLERWILLGILSLCVVWGMVLYLPRSHSDDVIAVISVNGQEYLRVDLSEAQNRRIDLRGSAGKPVSFEVSENRIRFVDVTCPDHVCEKAGWCSQPGDRAVCMPNRTALICYTRGELPKGSASHVDK